MTIMVLGLPINLKLKFIAQFDEKITLILLFTKQQNRFVQIEIVCRRLFINLT